MESCMMDLATEGFSRPERLLKKTYKVNSCDTFAVVENIKNMKYSITATLTLYTSSLSRADLQLKQTIL